MRNLKKILALVLALMMTLSLMVTANASNFTDANQVSDEYEEAVEVLSGMGVFQGDDKGQLLPNKTLSRKEAAVLVYRLLSGDVKDKYLNNYKGYAAKEFSDVSADAWYEPYVAYAVNGNYIKGDGKGHFNPDDDIKGTEVLTILLRAVGYDQNDEFSQNWPVTVATLAKELKVTDTVSGVLLTKAVSREVVAELIFRTITKVDMVNYTPAFGYQPIKLSTGSSSIFTTTQNLGEERFGLCSTKTMSIDDWGRPGHRWYATKISSKPVATIAEVPVKSYDAAVTQCDVATVLGIDDKVTAVTYTNGAVNEGSQVIKPTATTSTIGAQGRLTEVYDLGSDGYRIVYIDTLLAEVTNVKKATYDAAGHLKSEATIVLEIYDSDSTSTQATETNGEDNYDYSVGDMVLVNAVQYTTNRVRVNDDQYIDILNVAPYITGAQSRIWSNAAKHTVNGDVYDDAVRFHLDNAGISTANYYWFFDNYGNLIGNAKVANVYSYGVLTNIYWKNMDGVGAAYGTVTYLDGNTSGTVEIASIDIYSTDDGKYVVDCAPEYAQTGNALATRTDDEGNNYVGISTWSSYNDEIIDSDLYQIYTNKDGSLSLTAVDELKNAIIVTGKSLVSGDAGKGSTVKNIYTTATTQYLIQSGSASSGYTYTPVTGNGNVENYTKNGATVDYVLNSAGTRVLYAFIKGSPDSTETSALVYVPADYSHKAILKGSKIVGYELWVLNVDGELEEIETDVSTFKTLTKNVGTAYLVDFEDGEAVSATKIANPLSSATDVSSIYGTNMFVFTSSTYTYDSRYNQLTSGTGNTVIDIENAVISGDANLTENGTNTVYVLVNTKTLEAKTVWVSAAKSTGNVNVNLSVSATELDVRFNLGDGKTDKTQTVSVAAGETLTNVALVKTSGNAWSKEGANSYAVTVTASDGSSWTAKNVKTDEVTMTFDLVAPASVTANTTLTFTWTANP